MKMTGQLKPNRVDSDTGIFKLKTVNWLNGHEW